MGDVPLFHRRLLKSGFKPTSATEYGFPKYLNLSMRLLSSETHQKSGSPLLSECIFDCCNLPYIPTLNISSTWSKILLLVLRRTHVKGLRETQVSPPSHVTRARGEPTLRIRRSERNAP